MVKNEYLRVMENNNAHYVIKTNKYNQLQLVVLKVIVRYIDRYMSFYNN